MDQARSGDGSGIGVGRNERQSAKVSGQDETYTF